MLSPSIHGPLRLILFICMIGSSASITLAQSSGNLQDSDNITAVKTHKRSPLSDVNLNTLKDAKASYSLPLSKNPNAKPLKPMSPSLIQVKAGKLAEITVKAEPNVWVVFYTADGGQFTNGLSYSKLKSNAEGIVKVTFVATKDIVGYGNIYARSAVHSHSAQFTVEVLK